jgi:DNA-binding Xre family transcriptional regulator
MEQGTTSAVSLDNLERLGDALGCDPGYLIVKRPGEPQRRKRR